MVAPRPARYGPWPREQLLELARLALELRSADPRNRLMVLGAAAPADVGAAGMHLPVAGSRLPLLRSSRRGERALNRIINRFFRNGSLTKTDEGFSKIPSPGVGCHDDNDVPEIRLSPGIVGQRRVIHHLKQNVEYILMCFLDFIE